MGSIDEKGVFLCVLDRYFVRILCSCVSECVYMCSLQFHERLIILTTSAETDKAHCISPKKRKIFGYAKK